MADVTTPKMTAEEFFAWANRPENRDRHFELERGRLITCPPRSFDSTRRAVLAVLQEYVLRRKIGSLALWNDGLVVSRDQNIVRSPDFMVFGAPLDDDFPPRFTDERPQLIVEILSDAGKYRSGVRRAVEYVEAGIPLVWHLDADFKTAIVYEPNRFPKPLDEADDLTGNGVLPDFACKVADLFALPGQQPPRP